MLHRHVVPSAKTFTIVMPRRSRHIWVTILIAVIHIRPSMVLDILPRSLDPVMKALPPNVVPEVRWRSIPSTLITRSIAALSTTRTIPTLLPVPLRKNRHRCRLRPCHAKTKHQSQCTNSSNLLPFHRHQIVPPYTFLNTFFV